jgi:hypothetical protein
LLPANRTAKCELLDEALLPASDDFQAKLASDAAPHGGLHALVLSAQALDFGTQLGELAALHPEAFLSLEELA